MSGEKHAPELPEVVDEAGDSAPWVSQVGVVLCVVLAIFAAIHLFGTRPAETAVHAAGADEHATDAKP